MSYGIRHCMKDAQGQARPMHGASWFTRCNFHWFRIDSTVAWTDAPDQAPMHQPTLTITADSAGNALAVNVPPTAYNPPLRTLILWAYIGRQVTQAVESYGSPWNYAGNCRYTGVWFPSPWVLTPSPALVSGKRISVRVIAQDILSGAISSHYQATGDVL